MSSVLLEVKGLKKYFPVKTSLFSFKKSQRLIHAVDSVNFSIRAGETFSLVGETGCGKTTTGRLLLRLIEPTSGDVIFDGRNLFKLNKKELRSMRRNMQMIFQDPFASLNPRVTVKDIVGLPFKIYGIAKGVEREKLVADLLEKVGLTPASQFINRYPHEFSGGQRQRIGVARAIALRPKFIVADEPVSSLDISVRSQILNLMQDLKSEFKLTYLLIAHDLSVIRHMSDFLAIMYLGKIVELASSEDFFISPQHPYAKALIAAVRVPDPSFKGQRIRLRGEIPSRINPPKGCLFNTRCPYVSHICEEQEPILLKIKKDHFVACHMLSR